MQPFQHKRIDWSSPWIIALVPFLITLFFTGGLFKKYKLTLLSEKFHPDRIYNYHDLDGDGKSELLDFTSYQGRANVMVKNMQNQLEEVYNLPGSWFLAGYNIPVFYVGDAGKDKIAEIYTFTITDQDSFFVSIVNHYSDTNPVKSKFVSVLKKHNQSRDHRITPLGLEDNNGDGKPELIFLVNAGFPLQPRAVFAWDLQADSVYHSPLIGVAIKDYDKNFYFEDINGDSINELFVRTVATDNYKVPVPYSDTCGWAMVFTKNLQFLFEPIPFSGAQTSLWHFPLRRNDSLFVGAYIQNERPDHKHPAFCFFDLEGNTVGTVDYENPEINRISAFFAKNNSNYFIYVNRGNTIIHLLDNNFLTEIRTQSLSNIGPVVFYDIDRNGTKELLFVSEFQNKLYVISSNLKYTSEITLSNVTNSAIFNTSVALKAFKPDHFIVNIDGVICFLTYGINTFYYLNFLFATAYYLLLVLVFSKLKKAWLANLIKKQQTEQEMQQLQMQTVLNQLNPHFTYNAINAVGSAILNNEPRKAYDNLARLSKLFRRVVDHAFQPYKTLGEEIDFVRDYLEVEKSRFGEKLDFEITVQNGIDLKTKVPKMLIHLFVENAIKHGLFYKKEGGKITVSITQQPEAIKIMIQDNGVGRAEAARLGGKRKGKGMLILKNYLRLFKEQFYREITFEIHDFTEEQRVCGTKVEINVQI